MSDETAREHVPAPEPATPSVASQFAAPVPARAAPGLLEALVHSGTEKRAAVLTDLQRNAGNVAVCRMLTAPSAQRVLSRAAAPGGGASLRPDERAQLEAGLGRGLPDVRVHEGPAAATAAREAGAVAYTRGRDVVLGDAAASEPARSHVLAHEVAHVAQQEDGRVPRDGGVTRPGDPLEREAEATAQRVTGGAAAPAPPSVEAPGDARTAAPAPPTAAAPPAAASPAAPPAAPVPPAAAPPAPRAAAPAAAAPGSTPKAAGAGTPGGASSPAGGPVNGRAAAAPAGPAARPSRTGAGAGAGPAGAGVSPAAAQAPGGAAPGPGGIGPAALPPAPGPAPVAAPGVGGPGAAAASRYLAHAQAVGGRIAEERASALARVSAAAASTRAEISASAAAAVAAAEQAFAGEQEAVAAEAAAANAAVAAAAQEQREAVGAAAAAQQERSRTGVQAARTSAAAHAQGLQAEALRTGEEQAARVQTGTRERADGARTAATEVPAPSNPDAANAMQEGSGQMGAKSAGEIEASGTQLAGRVRQEAAHHARTTYGDTQQQFDAELATVGTEVGTRLTEFAATADAGVSGVGEAARSTIAASAQTAAAGLAGELTEAVAQIRDWERGSLADLAASEEEALARVQADTAAAEGALAQRAAEVAGEIAELEGPGAEAAAVEAAAELDAEYTEARAAMEAWTSEVTGGFAASGATLREQGARMGAGVAEAAGRAGARVRDTLGEAAQRGRTEMTAAAADARRRMTAAVDEASGKVRGAEQQYRQELSATQGPGAEALGKLADDGLASQDDLVERTRRDAASTAERVDAKSTELAAEAEQRSAEEQGSERTQAFLGAIGDWISDLAEAARGWLTRTFGEFWGGLIFGVLAGLVMVLIGLAAFQIIGAMIASSIIAVKVAGIVLAVVAVVAVVGFSIYNRFAEFSADTGRDPGFWESVALVGLGVADLTGIPFLIEGAVGRRAFSPRPMTPSERGERIGLGAVFVVAMGVGVYRGVVRFRARPGRGAPAGERAPAGGERPATPGERTGTGEGQRDPATPRPAEPMREGAYEGADPARTPQGWTFNDLPVREEGDLRIAETRFTAPDGAEGMARRAVNRRTGALEMQEINVPRSAGWIGVTPEVVPGKGMRTAAYLTMRLMRILGVPTGGLRSVWVRNIWNLRAILELRRAMASGAEPNQAVLLTNSVTSQEAALIQSGHRIAGAEVHGGRRSGLRELLEYWETKQETLAEPDAAIVEQHRRILEEFGLTRDQAIESEFLWDYDIEVRLEPAQPGAPVVAPPVTVPVDDQAGQ